MNEPKLRFHRTDGLNYPDADCKKLSEITDVRDGTHDSPKFWESGYPLVTSKNIVNGRVSLDDVQYISAKDYEEINKRSKVDVEDILMSMIGTIGNFAYINENPEFAIKNVALIKNVGRINSLYLYYYLSNPSFINERLKEIEGGTQKFIALNKIRNFMIKVPCEEEQQKIADFLSTVDDKIALKQKKYDALVAAKKGLLQKIFSREIRFRRDDGEEYSEWDEMKLNEIADITGGGTPSTSIADYWNGGISWFSPTEIGKTKYVSSSIKTISKQGLNHSSARMLPAGTVLLTTRATLGEMSIATVACTTNQGFQSLNAKNGNLNMYLYYLQPIIKAYCLRYAAGNTFLEISKKTLGECLLPVPCVAEQQKIADFFSTFDERIEAVKKELEGWKTIKKGLLQHMFY